MEITETADSFIKLLNESGMKETIEVFKKEFGNMNKGKGSNNLLNMIYKQLNNPIKEVEKIKTSKKNKLSKEEESKIMIGLIDKISKKWASQNTTEDNSKINDLSKTKVFSNLMSKYENRNQPTLENHNKNEENEDELPHFGGSSKKATISPKNNIFQGAINYSNQEQMEVVPNIQINHQINQLNSNLNSLQKSLPNNPNNTINRNESQNNDDSIFGETEENNNDHRTKVHIENKFQAPNNLDHMIKTNVNNNIFAMINNNQDNIDSSSFFQNSQSLILQQDNIDHNDSNVLGHSMIDEYVDDDDPGFDLYETEIEHLKETCKNLSQQYDFPKRAVYKSKNKNNENLTKLEKEGQGQVQNIEGGGIKSVKATESKKNIKGEQLFEVENKPQISPLKKSLLSSEVKFMPSGDPYYPVQYNNVIYDAFNLKVIVDRERTGFEESKEFKIVVNSLIAGRYQVIQFLGSAAFSKAIKVNKHI
jgi:hypothetical protein